MESLLKQYFGYSTFRPYQKEIIEKILEGRDSLVVMATGSGKSLCYQIPPLVTKKTAVIISPLISLMQDQVMALKERGIRAEYLSSAQTDSNAHSNAAGGKYSILYMTPEKACRVPQSFWSNLLNTGICLLAIDEAHCISEWGHDFRVEYQQLGSLRDILSDVPFVGLTATATEKVRVDICNSLKMRDPHVTIGSFDRRNLSYAVKSFIRGSSFLNELVAQISKYVAAAGSTIIYCTTIKDVEEICRSLGEAGINAGKYHGQMASNARTESHRSFIRDELQVMVATIAFGMGIDKPDIRHVIHYGCPKSLESYYQESGRCGRDGIASDCWLYYTRSDFSKANFYCGEATSAKQKKAIMESFMAAQHYCMLATCRRKFLLQYFGETYTSETCGNCDNCTSSINEHDMSREAFLLMSLIHSCGGNWGLNMPVDVLRGSRAKKVTEAQYDKSSFHGLGKEFSANWWKTLGFQLISSGYLIETVRDIYRFVSVSPKGLKFLNSCSPDYQPPLLLPLTRELIGGEDDKSTVGEDRDLSTAHPENEGLSQAETELYKLLLEERMKLARAARTAPYAICGDLTLKRIVLTRPSTTARLANIEGVNQGQRVMSFEPNRVKSVKFYFSYPGIHLVTAYGDHFLRSIQQHSRKLDLTLDRSAVTVATTNRKVYTVPNHRGVLSRAKFEVWEMWQEDGLSVHAIAICRSIKETTVLGYLLDAAQVGSVIDWPRLSKELGLTQDIFANVQAAILKVGSKEKLKPIKDELPEEISYSHIKACLTLLDLGMSAEALLTIPENSSCNADKKANGTAERSTLPWPDEYSCEPVRPVLEKSEAAAYAPLIESNCSMQALASTNDLRSPMKRQKVESSEAENPTLRVATENSVLELLKNFEHGVTLSDVLKHFDGSAEDSVVSVVSSLESEFLIYKKNDIYRLL